MVDCVTGVMSLLFSLVYLTICVEMATLFIMIIFSVKAAFISPKCQGRKVSNKFLMAVYLDSLM